MYNVVKGRQCYVHHGNGRHRKHNFSHPLYDFLSCIRKTTRIVYGLLHDIVEQLVIVITIKWRLESKRERAKE